MYTRDYLRLLIEIFWITSLLFFVCVAWLFLFAVIVSYIGAGNVVEDTVKYALDW